MMSLYPTAVDLDHALSRFGPVSAAPVSDSFQGSRVGEADTGKVFPCVRATVSADPFCGEPPQHPL